MKDKEPSPTLDDLDAKLRKARRDRPGPEETKDPKMVRSGLGFGLKIGVELVAALAVGVGIGLLLDRWLDTAPLFLVVFFFMGSAAGFLNVYRAVSGYGYAAGYRRDNNDPPRQDDPPNGDKGSE